MRAAYQQAWSTYVLGIVVTVVSLIVFGVFNGRHENDTIDLPFGKVMINSSNHNKVWTFSPILMQQEVDGDIITAPTEYSCDATAASIHESDPQSRAGDNFHLARASCTRMHACAEIAVITVKTAWFVALLGGTPVYYSASHLLFIFAAISILYSWFSANEYWPVVANYMYGSDNVTEDENTDALVVLGVFVGLTSVIHLRYVKRKVGDNVYYPYRLNFSGPPDYNIILFT